MDCHYHPGRESTATCTVCGKAICPECSMNIAGKTYCKDCLEKIVGMSEPVAAPTAAPQSPISDTIQGMEPQYNEYDYYEKEPVNSPYNQEAPTREQIIGDVLNNQNTQQPNYDNSPYSLDFDNPGYAPQQAPDNQYVSPSSYGQEPEYYEPQYQAPEPPMYQEPQANEGYYQPQEPPMYQEPQANENYYQVPEPNMAPQANEGYYQPQEPPMYQEPQQQMSFDDGFIYPDHSYQPPEMPNRDMGNKYESYLDDLYVAEPEIPLSEQIAKDEEAYGSLTKSPYEARQTVEIGEEVYYEAPNAGYSTYVPPAGEYQDDGFIKLNNVNHNNPQGDFVQQRPQAPQQGGIRQGRQSPKQQNTDNGMRPSTRSIHNIRNMEMEKEPYGAVDILLTIILVILIIVVVSYIIYLFFLSSTYPTFLDAIMGLKDPGTLISNLGK